MWIETREEDQVIETNPNQIGIGHNATVKKGNEEFHIVNSVQWTNAHHEDEEWLVDSGAMVNVTRNHKHKENVKICDLTITMGNGDKVNVTKQRDIVLKEKKMGMLISIQAMMVCAEFPLNTLSTKKLLQKGHAVVLKPKQGYIECK
jgi:hypothetical protein